MLEQQGAGPGPAAAAASGPEAVTRDPAKQEPEQEAAGGLKTALPGPRLASGGFREGTEMKAAPKDTRPLLESASHSPAQVPTLQGCPHLTPSPENQCEAQPSLRSPGLGFPRCPSPPPVSLLPSPSPERRCSVQDVG